MTKRKRKKTQRPQRIDELKIVCRGCISIYERTIKPMLYKGCLFDDGNIKSQGLSLHLSNYSSCSLYYHQNMFCTPEYNTSRVDLYPDLTEWYCPQSQDDLYLGQRFKRSSFTSHHLGLTRIGACNDSHSPLDNQVMYDDIPVGQLSRNVVDSTLIRECDESTVDFRGVKIMTLTQLILATTSQLTTKTKLMFFLDQKIHLLGEKTVKKILKMQ